MDAGRYRATPASVRHGRKRRRRKRLLAIYYSYMHGFRVYYSYMHGQRVKCNRSEQKRE